MSTPSDHEAPLSPDVRAFFEAAPPPMPTGLEARLLARLQVAMPVAPLAPASAAAPWAAKSALIIAGVVLGVAGDRLVQRLSAPVPVEVQAAPTPVFVAAPAPVDVQPDAPPAVPEPKRVPPRPVLAAPAPPEPVARDTQLATERNLLEVARTALSQNDAARALASLESHAAQFPNGALVEERELLMVRTLQSLGRTDEARARAMAFEARFPESPLRSAVRHIVGD